MKNITYLLGAGASYHSLPLISTMNKRMKIYSRFLKDLRAEGKLTHSFADTFISKLDEIIKHESENTSIDAYAKVLYKRNQGGLDLLHLKAILSSYLIFEQLIKPEDLIFYTEEVDYSVVPAFPIAHKEGIQNQLKTVIDKRYKTFLAQLLDVNSRLPNDIKIMSWNYDMQIEAAYSHITRLSLEYAQQALQIFPSSQKSININSSCVLKLNGTAGLVQDASGRSLTNWFDLSKHQLMDSINYLIDLLGKNYSRAFSNPQFYFAWEKEGAVNQTREYAKDIMRNTDTLVVIGYSFPSFNKDVDRDLFGNYEKLTTIYYQAPENEIPELLDNLDDVNTNLRALVKPVTKLDTFKIPSRY